MSFSNLKKNVESALEGASELRQDLDSLYEEGESRKQELVEATENMNTVIDDFNVAIASLEELDSTLTDVRDAEDNLRDALRL